jgi:spore germination protein YaaH
MHKYSLDITFKEYINSIVVLDKPNNKTAKAILDDIPLRYEPNRRSPIQKRLSADETLVFFGTQNDFSLVMTSEGFIGYVAGDSLAVRIPSEHLPVTVPIPPAAPFPGRINMVWDLVVNLTSVQNEARRYAPRGLDVISPSFFEFCFTRLDGTLVSIADQGYMDWARAHGIQVWPMIADFSHTERTQHGIISQQVLANTAHRENTIGQILMYVEKYGFEGINIDFEHIRRDDGVYYVQFIRELAPLLRERDVILSVCKYVPMAHTMHYNRAETAFFADYVVVMAYDEHYATSRVAGPNASIDFVRRGITRTMEEVPAHQIILGIPFYVRVWRETETAQGIVVSQNALGMENARNLFLNNGATFEWCEATLSYYAEYRGTDSDGQTYTRRVWLECERSIQAKLDEVLSHNLAGTSAWRKGFEKPVIWDILYENLK